MNLVSISEESGGTVKKDDVIIKIGDDNLTGWTLMRGHFNDIILQYYYYSLSKF